MGVETSGSVKLEQHRNVGLVVARRLRPPTKAVLSVLERVEQATELRFRRSAAGKLEPAYQGSVASVFLADCADRVYCVKYPTDYSLKDSAALIRTAGSVAGLANQAAAAQSARNIADALEGELDMELEAQSANTMHALLEKNKAAPQLKRLPCEARVHEHGAVCGTCVYEHVDGLLWNGCTKEQQRAIVLTSVGLHFYCLENHGLLLGDLNVGNFVLVPQPEGTRDVLHLLDHGAVLTLSSAQKALVASMAEARTAPVGAVSEWVMEHGGVPVLATHAETVARALVDGEADFGLLRPVAEVLADESMIVARMEPEVATIMRAQVHMCETLRELKIQASLRPFIVPESPLG